ncbi:hypothetical protein [Halothiobacillus sp. DCM-1]|uniref:hypothetical protein n=1 Tax=Halothiobacillus sp. DCM-1 TaxID=3112558 RepID=UPI003251D5BD
MEHRTRPPLALLALASLLIAAPLASADTLEKMPDINRAKPGSEFYVHGLSMSQVEKRFGAPKHKQAPVPAVGTRYNPPITRWDYPQFTVYFEHGRAIHLVKDHKRVE